MSGKRTKPPKTSARTTLGARKRAKIDQRPAASAPLPADEASQDITSSSSTAVGTPLLAQPPPVETETPVYVDSVKPRADAPRARTSMALLDAIDAVLGSESENGAGALRGGERVSNWTVRNPGKVVPPTSNEYDLWTVVQLRKECAERKFRLGRKATKPEQIRHLLSYDAARRAVQSSVDDENLLEPRLRTTKNCVIRLLNIYFPIVFAERLASSDDTATRDQIDAGEENQKTAFWKEIGVTHRTNTADFYNLFGEAANDPRYDGIDPSVIVEQDTAKFYDMWKIVNGKFVKALDRFNVSGQNSNDYYNFCYGNLDVAYRRVCTRVKPELEGFVSGGMHDDDEIDSLNLPVKILVTLAKSSKWQDQVLKTINRMADIFVQAPATVAAPSTSRISLGVPDEDVLIDRIAKLQRLIDQVKETQRKLELCDGADPTLTRSLGLYQQCLQHYENQLAALD